MLTIDTQISNLFCLQIKSVLSPLEQTHFNPDVTFVLKGLALQTEYVRGRDGPCFSLGIAVSKKLRIDFQLGLQAFVQMKWKKLCVP